MFKCEIFEMEKPTLLSFNSPWQASQNLKRQINALKQAETRQNDHSECGAHLSPSYSSSGVSWKASRGKRWWKERAKCGAETKVRPAPERRQSENWTHRYSEDYCKDWRTGTCWDPPHTLHSTGSSVYLARHCGQ